MKIVVNDANILIDLVELDLLEAFFAMDCRFVTTSMILHELFEDQQFQYRFFIDSGRLEVIAMNEEALEAVFSISRLPRGLSEQDCSAFYLAQQLEGILLTGDNRLRRFADKEKI